MSRRDLAKVVRTLGDVANKRLKRMEGKGIKYGEYTGESTISGVRKFSTASKSVGELRAEYKRVTNFLKAEQSSLTGMKKVYKRFIKELSDVGTEYVNRKDLRDTEKMTKQLKSRGNDFYATLNNWRELWNMYNRLIEDGLYAPSNYDSNQVQKTIYTLIADNSYYLSEDEIYEKIKEQLNNEYESLQQKRIENTPDVSQFF